MTPEERRERACAAGAIAAARERRATEARREVRAHALLRVELDAASARVESLRSAELRAIAAEGPILETRREVRERAVEARAVADFWWRFVEGGLSRAWSAGHQIDVPGARAAARDRVLARRREVVLAALDGARDRALEILLEVAQETRSAR